MQDSRAKELVELGGKLFSSKQQWDQLCQDIAENFYPLRADFTTKFTLGEDFSESIMDSYPVQARETLGNAPQAMLRQGEWFKPSTSDPELDERPDAAKWLEKTGKRFRKLVYDRRAKFVKATNEADHDWVAFGNPVLSVEISPITRDHLLFRTWHPSDCAWMENSIGTIDHLQRKMSVTARNMKRRWGDKIHPDIAKCATSEPNREFKVRHIVMPTDEIYGDDKKKRREYAKMPFLSLYVDCEHETILGEAGLPTFNYIAPRWRTITGYAYGFSPAAINALPDGRMLQSLARIILEQGEKAIDPPMVAKAELFRDAVNLYAGGLTYVDLEDDQQLSHVMQTLETGNLAVGQEMKADVRELIAEAFLLNKLFLPNVREMTAYETQQRMEEFRRAALPFFGPIESEYHLPLLDAAFTICMVNKQFDISDMPDDLGGTDITFNFDSPLNTADGRAKVSAFQESIQIIAGAAEFDNSIPSKWDLSKMVEDAVRGTGAPPDWEVDEAVQQSAEQAAAQTEQLQRAAEMLRGGAGVATEVAGATIAMKEAGLA